ncbi:MAG: peptidase M15 [Thermoplasmata archaeon]|nr:MAG: peptidase M15 [Thermoplasmata archaeon]
MSEPTWEQITYFRPDEFRCRCCGEERMSLSFILTLDDLRTRLGFPLHISSGYRCPWHNDQVSTTGFNGPHTTGRAADVLISGEDAFRLVTQSSLGGWFTGIGINQKGPHDKRFIHLDDLTAPDHPRPRLWSYA